MFKEGILEPEKLEEMAKKYKITLQEARDIIKAIDMSSSAPFDTMERDALIFVGTAWKMKYISDVLMQEIMGPIPLPH